MGPEIDKHALHHCADQLSQDFLPPGWERVASSAFSRVACNRDLSLYCKEFLARSPAESLKAFLRGSRASRARSNGDALRYAGIDAPRNIHWGRLDNGAEYLFTEALPGSDVGTWLREHPPGSGAPNAALRRELLDALGRFVGRVHASGFVHGDLRPGNVLAWRADDRFRFGLVDNERNARLRPPPGRLLLRNLMQLNMLPPEILCATDRMRFFRAWRRQMRELSAVEAGVLGAEAYRWARRRMRGAA